MASKSTSRTLTDHDEIRQWAEERDAKPAIVRSTHDAESSGIIRLDFPGYSGEGSLEEIEWQEWFDDFDRNNLALVVQDQTADGEQSNFNKLVSRENVEDYSAETSERRRGKPATKKAAEKASKNALKSQKTSSKKRAGSSKSNQEEPRRRQRSGQPSKKKAA